MEDSDCQERLKFANIEWERQKRRLEKCESALMQAQQELNEVARTNQEYEACRSSLEEAHSRIQALRRERDELLGFRRMVSHPDFWVEDVAYPLARALQEAGDILIAKTPTGRPRKTKDPIRIVRSWAYKLYKKVGPGLSESDKKEIEAYLIALWHWVRLEDVRARFEKEDEENHI